MTTKEYKHTCIHFEDEIQKGEESKSILHVEKLFITSYQEIRTKMIHDLHGIPPSVHMTKASSYLHKEIEDHRA